MSIDKLIERLRAVLDDNEPQLFETEKHTLSEAADRLASTQAEILQLKAALEDANGLVGARDAAQTLVRAKRVLESLNKTLSRVTAARSLSLDGEEGA